MNINMGLLGVGWNWEEKGIYDRNSLFLYMKIALWNHQKLKKEEDMDGG
jgi:hypothetical protein